MKEKKFCKDYVITNIADLDFHLSHGRWIYMHNKPLHPAFITSMMYRTVKDFCSLGYFRLARPNTKGEVEDVRKPT